MDTRRIEWDKDKEFTEDQVRSMSLKKYNNLLTSERWYSKYPKDTHILALFGFYQKLMDDSKKTSHKSNRK